MSKAGRRNRACIVLALIGGVGLGACEPWARTRTKFTIPAGVQVEPEQLRVDVGLDGGELEPTTRGRWELEDGQGTVRFGFSAARVEVQIRIWADLDGDGELSPGDLVGRLPAPVLAQDNGCWGNMTHTPDITLAPVEG